MFSLLFLSLTVIFSLKLQVLYSADSFYLHGEYGIHD